MSGLRRLDLRSTPVTEVSPLADLSKLQTLNLRGTPVTDVLPLEHIKDLEIFGP